jgi:hypothetical protein
MNLTHLIAQENLPLHVQGNDAVEWERTRAHQGKTSSCHLGTPWIFNLGRSFMDPSLPG